MRLSAPPASLLPGRWPGRVVLLISFLCVHGVVFSADKASTEQNKSALSKYWFKQEQLDTLPEPKPTLSPQCEGVFFQPVRQASEEAKDSEEGQQTISADRAIYQTDGSALFEGHVLVEQAGQFISGDTVRYDRHSKLLDITGNVQVEQPGLVITSEQAQYDNSNERSMLENAEFLLFESGLNGRAQHIDISKQQTHIRNNSITSCPPGKENWLLKSNTLHLDQEKGWGYATHASLHLAKVPVLYMPYFTFPLDDRRKTGFLYPSLGSDSVNGSDIALPYYLNLAPNYDATLTPRLLSKRGEQIAGEFRYLNSLGEGEISGDYLGGDKLHPVYSERKQAQWHHRAQFAQHWDANADYYYVSDEDYYDDLDSFSSNTALGYLQQNASLSYIKRNTYLAVLVQDFEVLDPIAEQDQPYRLAPQINAGLADSLFNSMFHWQLDSQLSAFERDIDASVLSAADISEGQLSTGKRLVVQPGLSADISKPGYFIRPAVRLHHRQYQVEDYQSPGQDAELDYDIPIYTLDSGMMFERQLNLSGKDYLQTLEPRMKLLGIPYRDQSRSPDFDTGLLTFNQDQLYRDRRYSGHDLLGDTRQLTVGLGSRLYNNDGLEKLRVHAGQIFYAKERRISLSPIEDSQAKRSPFVADASVSLIPNWVFSQQILWDTENNELDQVATGIFFKNALDNIINLEFRYRPVGLGIAQKETRASFIWPLSDRWKAMSFWNYDLNERKSVELASGVEYENCCVIVRALNQKWLRKVSSTNTFESANKQSLEIQLKGLGNLNNQITDYLKNKIPGFNDN